MKIPPRFEHASFETFEAHTESQRQALIAVQGWLSELKKGHMLALVGKQGTGKSHLLYSALRYLTEKWENVDPKVKLEAARDGEYVPTYAAAWYRLADELRYGSGNTESIGVRMKLWEAKIVLLDEVRPTSGTGFDDSELAKFACHAYDNRVAVLITTNVSPLENLLGPAAASRFAAVTIDGPDARQEAA